MSLKIGLKVIKARIFYLYYILYSCTKSTVMAFDDSQDNYLHLCLIFYELSGLRATSKPFLKILSLYVFYPVMMIIFAMMFYNIRYQHANVIETADVFASISIFASVKIN